MKFSWVKMKMVSRLTPLNLQPQRARSEASIFPGEEKVKP